MLLSLFLSLNHFFFLDPNLSNVNTEDKEQLFVFYLIKYKFIVEVLNIDKGCLLVEK